MARKRMIDPGYWSDDKIIELEPIQRLLFIGMWNFADDAGVLKYSPKQIKARIFPADTNSPAYFLTPNLFDLLSLPFREVPLPCLCANGTPPLSLRFG